LLPSDLVLPLFVHDQLECIPIESLSGHYLLDEISLIKQCEIALKKGISSVALFPVIDKDKKTPDCAEALNQNNLMCHATRRLKKTFGDDLVVIGDIACDPYSSDGHDGLVKDGIIVNDSTVEILSKMACIQAEAGVDILAPSDMMDGRVFAIRQALDSAGFSDRLIMSYTAKYASNFYKPFRAALGSSPQFGDKKTYQMNAANRFEASMEMVLDLEECADIILVKPATMYLDIISEFKNSCTMPIAAYHVSGEYAMLRAGADAGYFDFNKALMEVLIGIKRAGANVILSYGALDIIHDLPVAN
jgi:porphobilinogen synthase